MDTHIHNDDLEHLSDALRDTELEGRVIATHNIEGEPLDDYYEAMDQLIGEEIELKQQLLEQEVIANMELDEYQLQQQEIVEKQEQQEYEDNIAGWEQELDDEIEMIEDIQCQEREANLHSNQP